MTETTQTSVPERAETALFELLAERPFAEIGLAAVAERADVSLADLRRAWDGPFDVLSGFARRIDVAVLAEADPAMRSEPIKDRLFDALMRRFDLLAPHREGLAGLMRSARHDPLLAVHLTRLVVGSQVWMLEASGVAASGPRGAVKAATLAAALVRVVPIFVEETDQGLPKTMAALDAALDRLGRLASGVGRFERAIGGLCGRRRSARGGATAKAEPTAGARGGTDDAGGPPEPVLDPVI